MIVYHGSNVAVPSPRILINGFYKDFGYGFNCTNIGKQAKRWALTRRGKSMVNFYEYTPNDKLLQLTFETMTEEWLDFVANCRLLGIGQIQISDTSDCVLYARSTENAVL